VVPARVLPQPVPNPCAKGWPARRADSGWFKEFQRSILRALVQVQKINAERACGHYREDEAPLPLAPTWSTAAVQAPAPQPVAAAPASDPASPPVHPDPTDTAAEAAHLEDFHERFAGILDAADDQAPSLIPNSLLSEAFAALKKAKEDDSKWVGETERRTRNSVELIIEILKDRPLNSYTRKQGA
jgi:hypothetical protein